MTCARFRWKIHLFLDGELEGQELEEFLAHARVCPACARKLREVQATGELLREALAVEHAPREAAALAAAVREELDKQRARGVARVLFRLPRMLRLALVAGPAVAVLCVAVYGAALPLLTANQRVQVYAPKRVAAESVSVVKVVAQEEGTGAPLAGVPVRLVAYRPGVDETVWTDSARTDATGMATVALRVPDIAEQCLRLEVSAELPGEPAVVHELVPVFRDVRLLLSTDKPVYQPGETMHIRALALQMPRKKPLGKQRVLITVSDARGNVVFREERETSPFGVAAAQFALAPRATVGSYQLAAQLGEVRAERTVRVLRCVVPRFRINITTDRDSYTPEDTLCATVAAFRLLDGSGGGRRVSIAEARVVVTVAAMDGQGPTFARQLSGTTDAEGKFSFSQPLRELIGEGEGRPLRGWVVIQATVTDSAEQQEKATIARPLASRAIEVSFLPKGGKLIRGRNSVVYVLTTYPDGAPARCNVVVRSPELRLRWSGKTDSTGVFALKLRPAGSRVTLRAAVRDSNGTAAEAEQTLSVYSGKHLAIVPWAAVYEVGDTLHAEVFSAERRGTVIVDVAREGQPVVVKTLALREGKAGLDVGLTEDLVGTLVLHAYWPGEARAAYGDTAAVFVKPADDLNVAIALDRRQYRPQSAARIRFSVTDKRGVGIPAAIGVRIVHPAALDIPQEDPALQAMMLAVNESLRRQREVPGEEAVDIICSVVEGPESGWLERRAKVLASAARPNWPKLSIAGETSRERRQRAWEHGRALLAAACAGLALWLALLLSLGAGALFPRARVAAALAPLRRPPGNGQAVAPLARARPVGRYLSRALALLLVLAGVVVLGAALLRLLRPSPVALEGPEGAGPREARAGAVRAAREAGPRAGRGDAALCVDFSRQFLPQTMFVNPAVVTDEHGRAAISVPVSGAASTWKISALANAREGGIGSAEAELRVAQGFSARLALPPAAVVGDVLGATVVLSNNSEARQRLRIVVRGQPWFKLLSPAQATVSVGAGQARAWRFTLAPREPGERRLAVSVVGSGLRQTVSAKLRVAPREPPVRRSFSGTLGNGAQIKLYVPAQATLPRGAVVLKLFGSTAAHVAEALDALAQGDCAALDRSLAVAWLAGALNRALENDAREDAQLGQRASELAGIAVQEALALQASDGGFGPFIGSPPTVADTARALLLLGGAAGACHIDSAALARAQRWLVQRQRRDGSFSQSESAAASAEKTFAGTAWAAWALARRDPRASATQRALRYLRKHMRASRDPLALAVALNALAEAGERGEGARQGCVLLAELAAHSAEGTFWPLPIGGAAAAPALPDIEATALCALALLRQSYNPALGRSALRFLLAHKATDGAWQTPLATAFAAQALALAREGRAAAQREVAVRIGGRTVARATVGGEGSAKPVVVDLSRHISPGESVVELACAPAGGVDYQLSATFYAGQASGASAGAALVEVATSYERTALALRETTRQWISVYAPRGTGGSRVAVEVPLPAGFEVERADLDELVAGGAALGFDVAPGRVFLWLDPLVARQSKTLSLRLRATAPAEASAGPVVAYACRLPTVRGSSGVHKLVVREEG